MFIWMDMIFHRDSGATHISEVQCMQVVTGVITHCATCTCTRYVYANTSQVAVHHPSSPPQLTSTQNLTTAHMTSPTLSGCHNGGRTTTNHFQTGPLSPVILARSARLHMDLWTERKGCGYWVRLLSILPCIWMVGTLERWNFSTLVAA